MPSPRRSVALSALAAFALSGCLSEPEGQSCDDLPPGAAGCPGADVGPDAEPGPGDADRPDEGVELDQAPPPDQGPDVDRGPESDQGPDPDMGPEPDMTAMACEPGTTQPCGTSQGECEQGQRFCDEQGRWGADCLGGVEPVDEECNGLDDNCDGQTDEGCECAPDSSRPCGNEVGECVAGEQLCVDGLWSESCERAVGPAEEVCDGLDNDCNGAVDDLAPVVEMRACTVGVGRCEDSGFFTCEGAGVDGQPVCDAVEGAPQVERCDRFDDDCDGRTDEEISPNASHLYFADRASRERMAIAPAGEFHGVAYINDGILYYGLASGAAWEIEPVEIGGFNGDDSIATHISLAPLAGGFSLGVVYDGLGSGILVQPIATNGDLLRRDYRPESPFSYAIDVANHPQMGLAVAFTIGNFDPAGPDIGVEMENPSGAGRERHTVSAGQSRLWAPSLAWPGDSISVAYIRSDPRTTEGDLQLTTWEVGSAAAGRTVTIVRGSAANPDLVWLPQHNMYLLAWDEPDAEIATVRRVRVAAIDAAGRVQNVMTMPAQDSAMRPSLSPQFTARAAVDTVAVSWDRPLANGFVIELGHVLAGDRGWVVAPNVQRVFSNQGGTTFGGVTAWSPEGSGHSVLHTLEDRTRQVVLSSVPGACPQRP